MDEPVSKRRRLSSSDSEGLDAEPTSLSKTISPPRKRRAKERILIPSPFRLTAVRDLPRELNAGSVSLADLLGDPLIAECWEFNYLHDVGFLMKHFDEDTRSLVKVHIIHGFWKKEDPNRIFLEVSVCPHGVSLLVDYIPCLCTWCYYHPVPAFLRRISLGMPYLYSPTGSSLSRQKSWIVRRAGGFLSDVKFEAQRARLRSV
jgi:hypothetical protein